MTLSEMHIWFRQYAQQMGIQNVRAILPEQIDLLINTSITDTVNQLIAENIGGMNDRIVTDNVRLSKINAFSTLYGDYEIDLSNEDVPGDTFTPITLNLTQTIGRILFLVDLSINYNTAEAGQTEKKTRLFPVRLIDNAYLADTLNDFVLSPKYRSPIAVTYNEVTTGVTKKVPAVSDDPTTEDVDESNNIGDATVKEDATKLDLYLGSKPAVTNLTPYSLKLSVIVKPRKVVYREDVGEANTDCDLPDYLHVDILKHAVDLYRVSVNNGLYNSQQQAQAQQQEYARNNNRPVNEGYSN